MPARLVFVCFAIFLLTSFITNLANRIALGKRRILLGASICIIMAFFVAFTITFSLPNTYYAPWPQNNLNLLSNHKVLVPPPAIYTINSSGVFAPLLNYSTTTGAYNQGDPSFYYLTVYYEWMSAFVNRTPSFLNIMQMTGSNAIIPMRNYSIYRENANFLGYSNGFPTYGLNSSLADSVTPIRIYAANQTEALRFSLFVNILANNGFSYVFTTQPVANTTDYVIFSDYNGTVQLNSTSKIIHVVNSSLNELVEVNSTDYILYTTALKESISIFPYNLYFPKAYFDNSSESIPNSMITNATFIANSLTAVFHPIYKPLGYSTGNNSYTVNQSNLPVLLKVSYYPYFTTSSNSTYTYDINHLMLLPAQGRVTIIWHLPLYEAAALISIISIILSVFYLTEGKNTLHYLKRAAKNPHQKIFK
jgi:hypothetical protein